MNSNNIILVVDDDADLLSVTVELLKQEGYPVIAARTGEQALQAAREHAPDLILLDHFLPDISGLDICRRLKADKSTSGTFICIVSGLKTTSSDQYEGFESGADEYIVRPLTNRELIARVKSMLRLRNAEKALESHRILLEELVDRRTRELRREIAERKRVEESRRHSEDQYRSMVDAVRDGIVLLAQSGEILTWNKGAEEIFEIPAEAVIGQHLEKIAWPTIHEDGSPYEGKEHPSLKTLLTGQPCRNEIMGIRRSSAKLRWISINTNPCFTGDEEKPSAVAISFTDITELKNTETMLREK